LCFGGSEVQTEDSGKILLERFLMEKVIKGRRKDFVIEGYFQDGRCAGRLVNDFHHTKRALLLRKM